MLMAEKTGKEESLKLRLSSLRPKEETIDHCCHLQELLNTLKIMITIDMFPLKYNKVSLNISVHPS